MLIHVAFQAFLLNILIIVSFTTSATRFPLIHRDNYNLPSSPHHNNSHNLFEALMKRDAMRVASLTHLLAANDETGNKYSMDLRCYAGQYVIQVGVGTPPQTQSLAIDTGSDMLWVQCQPCECYPLPCIQQFDPKKSTSFVNVSCEDSNCYKIDKPSRGVCNKTGQSSCTYDIGSVEGGEASGTMAIENITIGNTIVTNMTIGCTHKTTSMITEALDGILGLGGGPLSVVNHSVSGGMFSYCLNYESTNGGWLEFGRSNTPKGNIMWARLIHNIKYPSFYYIANLVGLSVGGEVLNIPEDTFQLNQETGQGGVVLDMGAYVTHLPGVAYEALRNKFKEKMVNYPFAGNVSFLDTCYDLGKVDGLNDSQVPNVTFNFMNYGVFNLHNITLDARNVVTEVDDVGKIYCLAFAPTDKNFSIIGSVQQQGISITIDAIGEVVGFGSTPCL